MLYEGEIIPLIRHLARCCEHQTGGIFARDEEANRGLPGEFDRALGDVQMPSIRVVENHSIALLLPLKHGTCTPVLSPKTNFDLGWISLVSDQNSSNNSRHCSPETAAI